MSTPITADVVQLGEPLLARDNSQVELLRATLRHAFDNTNYYGRAFERLSLDIDSLADLRRFPLLDRATFAKCGTDLLAKGTVPEYVGLTSGTTFGDGSRDPLLHFQTEAEHQAWLSLYGSVAAGAEGDRPLMVRLIDADRGVEVAGAFPGCFSLPMESLYHFELILSILQREWTFEGFSKRVMSLSGPLDALQLMTLLCVERGIHPAQFGIGVISSSGWQMTSRWRTLLESNWGAQVQDVYGVSEAPGMFATRCGRCLHYHFSPLSVIEVLRLDSDEPVRRGVGRVVVTCLLPLASAQPIIRYDTGDVIDVTGECGSGLLAFDYVGRRSKLVYLKRPQGEYPVLSPLMVTEILDSIPDVAVSENAKARRLGLRQSFGWPRYAIREDVDRSPRAIVLTVELRWAQSHYPSAARDLSELIRSRVLAPSEELSQAVERREVDFSIQLTDPGTLV